jgi:hypothetical protein
LDITILSGGAGSVDVGPATDVKPSNEQVAELIQSVDVPSSPPAGVYTEDTAAVMGKSPVGITMEDIKNETIAQLPVEMAAVFESKCSDTSLDDDLETLTLELKKQELMTVIAELTKRVTFLKEKIEELSKIPDINEEQRMKIKIYKDMQRIRNISLYQMDNIEAQARATGQSVEDIIKARIRQVRHT